MNLDPLPDLFLSLKAEHEPWLAESFVQPKGCDQAPIPQSAIIWGGSGAGKSALRLKLAGEVQQNYLVAHWMPEPPDDDSLQGTPLFNAALTQALRTCVESLVLSGNLYQRLRADQGWMKTSLAWFLRRYLPFEPVFYVHSRVSVLGEEQAAWFINLLQQAPQNIMADTASHVDQLRLLMFTLKAAGYKSIFLLVDGLERWAGSSDTRARQMIEAILSTLAVFDSADLVFKFFVPSVLRPRLEGSTGVVKYRVNQINLGWDAERLAEVLTRRVGYGLGRPITTPDFCKDARFWEWLSHYGAENPRTWLELARPFAEYFLRNSSEPLSTDCWRSLAQKYPPPLRIADQLVWQGELAVKDLTATEFDLLTYLEKNTGRYCSLEEIYYLGLGKLTRIPGKDDDRWLEKDAYRGVVDTAVYRLRHKLEPDPTKPIYVVTEHGKGLRLFPRGVYAL